MKTIVIAFLLLTTVSSCTLTDHNDSNISTDLIDNENPPVIEFVEATFDFGSINQGDVVRHDFTFTNTGKTPLVIQSVKADCGCTTPSWPKEMIQPGETEKISVQFDSEWKPGGKTKKMVSIVANTKPGTTKIYLTGTIIAPDKN